MEKLDAIVATAIKKIEEATNINILEGLRVQFLGKKGELTKIMKELANLDPKERPKFGALVNESKEKVKKIISSRKVDLEQKELDQKIEDETNSRM